jgi:hypothetical protein
VRILFINCEHYDYLTATLIEGLIELGHTVGCIYSSNYGSAIPPEEILPFSQTADLIVIGTASWNTHPLVAQMSNPRKVAVDGGDTAAYGVIRTAPVKAVFKRELFTQEPNDPADFIFPLPFAAEKRYFRAPAHKDIFISFVATMSTNPIRNSIHLRLLKRKHEAKAPRHHQRFDQRAVLFRIRSQGQPNRHAWLSHIPGAKPCLGQCPRGGL